MPIYEYACEDCGHTFDALQKISDERLKVCPSCGEPKLRKLPSAPSFRLKGTGWYETDFKKDHRRNLADSPAPESAKPDKGGKSGKTGSGGDTAASKSTDA